MRCCSCSPARVPPFSHARGAFHQKHYFHNIRLDARNNVDPQVPRYDALIRKVNQCAEPLSSWSAPCLGSTLSSLSLKFLAYFGEVYGDLYRRMLDETEDCGPGRYPFTFVATHVSRILADVLCDMVDQSTGSMPINEHILNLLFSSSSALPELFCISLVVFDVTWKELSATLFTLDKVLDELRTRVAALISSYPSIRVMKEAAGMLSVLTPTDTVKAKKTEPTGKELILDLNELLFDLFAAGDNLLPPVPVKSSLNSARTTTSESSQVPDSPKELPTVSSLNLGIAPSSADLSVAPASVRRLKDSYSQQSATQLSTEQQDMILDCVKAIQAIAGAQNFPWTYLNADFVAYLLRCLTFGTWLRHPELSQHATVFLELQMKRDADGIAKFEEALRLLTLDSNDSLYRPIVKLIRNNRTFPSTLRILNKMFETKTKDKARTRFLAELQRVDAMSILKSKVWSTSDDVRTELYKFQVMLLAVPEESFDATNAQHREVVVSLWEKAFPNLPLQILSTTQFELLGFPKVKGMNDFNEVTLVHFDQLLALLKFQADVFQHILLYAVPGDEEPLPAGEVGFAITDALIKRFTKSDLILPVLFDAGYESLHEVYILAFLWVVKEWRSSPSTKWPQLVENTIKLLAESIAKSKPVTIDELVQQVGLSFDSIRSSWLRARGRSITVPVPTLPVLDSADLDSDAVSMTAQSAKLNKMLGVGDSSKPSTAAEKSASPTTAGPLESSRDWAGKDLPSSVDIIDAFTLTHQSELAEREKALAKKVTKEIEGHKKSRSKRSRAARSTEDSNSSSDDDKPEKPNMLRNASKRLDIVGSEKAFQKQLEALNFEEFEGATPEQMVDAAWKRRKTEMKDQKELLKVLLAKHKAHQKKVIDELKNVPTQ